jgi:hypothetical protein
VIDTFETGFQKFWVETSPWKSNAQALGESDMTSKIHSSNQGRMIAHGPDGTLEVWAASE